MAILTIIDNSNKDNSAWWGDLTWPKKPLQCCDIWDIWSEWLEDMTWPKKSTYPPTYLSTYQRAHPQNAILGTCDLYDICSEWWDDLTWPKKTLRCCDIWDTDYNTVNWEPEFMTIFVTWQLICDTGQHSQFLRCFEEKEISDSKLATYLYERWQKKFPNLEDLLHNN